MLKHVKRGTYIKNPPSRSSGFLMVETLVSLVIFSIAVLGLVSMLSLSVKNSIQAEERMRAAVLASDMVTIIWLQELAGAADEIKAWETQLAAELPDGKGSVVQDGDLIRVSINWNPVWSESGAQRRQYSTVVVP